MDASFNQLGTSVRRALHGERVIKFVFVSLNSSLFVVLFQRRRCSAAVSEFLNFQASISLVKLLLFNNRYLPVLLMDGMPLFLLFFERMHSLF